MSISYINLSNTEFTASKETGYCFKSILNLNGETLTLQDCINTGNNLLSATECIYALFYAIGLKVSNEEVLNNVVKQLLQILNKWNINNPTEVKQMLMNDLDSNSKLFSQTELDLNKKMIHLFVKTLTNNLQHNNLQHNEPPKYLSNRDWWWIVLIIILGISILGICYKKSKN